MKPKVAGAKVQYHTISIDVLTDLAARLVMQKEACSYSAALCGLAMTAALNDTDIAKAIKAEVAHYTLLAAQSEAVYSHDFAAQLAKELLAVNEEG